MGRVGILCVWLKYHNHNITYTLKKYSSTMVTSRPRPRFAISQRILILFLPRMSAVLLTNARSWRYAPIHMGRKNPWVLLPERLWTQMSDITKFRRSRKTSRAIFYPADSCLSLLPSLLKAGGSGGVCRSKRGEFIVFLHFSRRTCMKSHLFHAIFPKSAANMQQSTLKEVRN